MSSSSSTSPVIVVEASSSFCAGASSSSSSSALLFPAPTSTSTPTSSRPRKNAPRHTAPTDGMCQVCSVVPFQFHHFGAFVCNRCRAFFRRCIRRQRRKAPDPACVSIKRPVPHGDPPICDISVFRGACKACRYAACVKAGMKAESVLTDDDRKQKYAKYKLAREAKVDQGKEKKKKEPKYKKKTVSPYSTIRASGMSTPSAKANSMIALDQGNRYRNTSQSTVFEIQVVDNNDSSRPHQYCIPPQWPANSHSASSSRTDHFQCGFNFSRQNPYFYDAPVANPPWKEEWNQVGNTRQMYATFLDDPSLDMNDSHMSMTSDGVNTSTEQTNLSLDVVEFTEGELQTSELNGDDVGMRILGSLDLPHGLCTPNYFSSDDTSAAAVCLTVEGQRSIFEEEEVEAAIDKADNEDITANKK